MGRSEVSVLELKVVDHQTATKEWEAIRDELLTDEKRHFVTAHDVTYEQDCRMRLRGERRMTYEEVAASLKVS